MVDFDDVPPISDIARAVAPLTMCSRAAVEATIKAAVGAIMRGTPGDLVECGVWKGGCSIAMALAQHMMLLNPDRMVHLFDSFEGLPPAEAIDGPAALAWQAGTDGPTYFDNCRASYDDLRKVLEHHGVRADCCVWPGWFQNTLPKYAAELGRRIAVLRIDCDWHASVKLCLDELAPLVSPGGVIIFDDYYAWDGCARAVHEWLAGRAERLVTIEGRSGALVVLRGAA